MRTRLFWILPFGLAGTAGGATIGAAAAVGAVEGFAWPGGDGGFFCCA
jgi:hypothetical protein